MLSKDEVRAAVASIVGEKNLLTGHEDLTCYTYNAGGAAPSPHIPILAVFPSTAEEVSSIVKLCNSNGISIVPRSQGSGLSVNAIPESDNSIILSMGTGADIVATGCSACKMQITDGLAQAGSRVRVLHTAELLARAYGL